MGREKRKGPRGQVSATVVLLREEQHLGAFRVLNLSTTGALLVGRPPSEVTEDLEVLVRLSTGRTIRAGATIVREDSVNEAGVFAVAFARVSAADLQAIGKVVLTAVEDARDATALVVSHKPELALQLRRSLTGLGHPSFAVTTREDALMFLDAPNILTVALVDLALKGAPEVLAHLAEHLLKVRRVVIAGKGKAPPTLAQGVLKSPWRREGLLRAIEA